MNIYKDKLGTYYADYTEGGKRVRRSLKTKQKSIAILKAGMLAQKPVGKGDYPNCPFIDLVERYKREVLSLRKPGTMARFMSAYHRLEQFGLPKTINEVTPDFLQKFQIFLKSISTSGKAAGINRNVRAIRTLMRQAEAWNLIGEQRWSNVHKLREPKGRVEFHSPEEIAILLDRMTPNWKLVILLGCRAGLRRGEMAQLRWQDIDFANNQIYVAPNKTDKHRFVPLAKDLRLALETAKNTTMDDFVVHVGEESARNSNYFITAAYKKHTEKLPFRCFLHKLRHTFASHLVQAGVDLYRVSKLLGHSSIKMTEIYAHLAPEDLQTAVVNLPPIPPAKQINP